MIMGNLLNLIMSPILVFKCGLGIIGLSIGTVLGNMVLLLLFLHIYLSHDKISTNLSFKEFKFDFNIIKGILKVSLRNFIDRSVFSFFYHYIVTLY